MFKYLQNHKFLFLMNIFFNIHSYSNFIDIQEVPEFKRADIAYVKEKYEHTIDGIQCLYYPAQNAKRLWVLCNGATVGRYTMWSWFWDPEEAWHDTSYLFLKDDQIRWYFGTEEQPLTKTYCDIITHFMQQAGVTKEQTYTIGHSMGGYAAIYFALLLDLKGVFALRPQIDWKYGTQFFSIKKLANQWVNLDEFVLQTNHTPLVYLQFGEFGPDKGAGEKFVHALLQKQSWAIIEKTLNTSHIGYHPTKDYIEAVLRCMEAVAE